MKCTYVDPLLGEHAEGVERDGLFVDNDVVVQLKVRVLLATHDRENEAKQVTPQEPTNHKAVSERGLLKEPRR